MPYSEVADLLLGDITVGANLDPQKYVDEAALEIDSKLSQVYILPLEADDPDYPSIPQFTIDNLKKISNWLATGRILLAINATSGDDTENRYGLMLVRDAQAELDAYASGLSDLVGAKRAPARNVGGDTYKGPTLVNADAASAVDTFYAGVMQGVTTGDGRMPSWRPGV